MKSSRDRSCNEYSEVEPNFRSPELHLRRYAREQQRHHPPEPNISLGVLKHEPYCPLFKEQNFTSCDRNAEKANKLHRNNTTISQKTHRTVEDRAKELVDKYFSCTY